MLVSIKEFVKELSQSDLMEHYIYHCNLTFIFNGHAVSIIPTSAGYHVLTPDGTLSLGYSLDNVGMRLKEYTDAKNGIGIIGNLSHNLSKYDKCTLTDDRIKFRGFDIHLEEDAIVAVSEDGDKFYFNLNNGAIKLSVLAEKINRFLK